MQIYRVFLVCLRRAVLDQTNLQDPFDPTNLLTPKERECVWNEGYLYEGRPKDKTFLNMQSDVHSARGGEFFRRKMLEQLFLHTRRRRAGRPFLVG